MRTLLAEPIQSEIMDPKKYINLSKEDKVNIESVKIIPTTLGSKKYGFLEVTYRFPVYRVKK